MNDSVNVTFCFISKIILNENQKDPPKILPNLLRTGHEMISLKSFSAETDAYHFKALCEF